MNQSQIQAVEGRYIPQARRVITAQRLRAKAEADEELAKRACAAEMHAAHMFKFDFTADEKRYTAQLARIKSKRVSVEKLYTLVKAGEISLADFLECVEPDPKKVLDLLGEQRKASIMERYKQRIDLVIRPKKNGGS